MSLDIEFAKLYQDHVYKTRVDSGAVLQPDNTDNVHGLARKVDYFHNPAYPKIDGVDATTSAILYTYPTQPTQSALDEQHPSYLVTSTVPRDKGLSFVDAGYLKATPNALANIWEFLPSGDGGTASSMLRAQSIIV